MPEWERMERLAVMETVADAAERFYRRERLNRDAGSRVRIIGAVARAIDESGHDLLASRHESTIGDAVWIRREDSGFGVYRSKEA